MKPILIFDPECILCTRFKKSLEMLDKERKIRFVPLTDSSLYDEYPILNQDDCEKEVHLLLSPAEVLRGDEVVKYIINMFPTAQKFSWLIESKSGDKAINFFYKTVNKMRGQLKNDCPKCRQKRNS